MEWPSGPEGGTYDSPDGMRSSLFSVVWMFLGMIGRNFPVQPTNQDKINYHEYLTALGNVLPCRACRENFKKNLITSGYDPEVHLQSRQAFSRFINHLHNTVNMMLGKPTVSYYEHRDFYEALRAKCTPSKQDNGYENGCLGSMHPNDPRATCIVSILPEKDAEAIKKLHNNRSVVMSEECKENCPSRLSHSRKNDQNKEKKKKKKKYVTRKKNTKKKSSKA